jgi:hypothetical protein
MNLGAKMFERLVGRTCWRAGGGERSGIFVANAIEFPGATPDRHGLLAPTRSRGSCDLNLTLGGFDQFAPFLLFALDQHTQITG